MTAFEKEETYDKSKFQYLKETSKLSGKPGQVQCITTHHKILRRMIFAAMKFKFSIQPSSSEMREKTCEPNQTATISSSKPFEYIPPEWSGHPSVDGDFSLELIGNGVVRARVRLDVQLKEFFVIGRAPECDVNLAKVFPYASRWHCILQCRKNSPVFYVWDLGSSHGTTLNRRPISPHTWEEIRVGHQLRFGPNHGPHGDCIAVLCGPEECMEPQPEFKPLPEPQPVKDVLRETLKQRALKGDGASKKVSVSMSSERRQKLQGQGRTFIADAECGEVQEVTWGIPEDPIPETSFEHPDNLLSEKTAKLCTDGEVDPDKVLALRQVTEDQKKLCLKLKDARAKLNILEKRAEKMEGPKREDYRRQKIVIDRTGQDDSTHKQQELDFKIYQLGEQIEEYTQDLFQSLGLKTNEASRSFAGWKALYDAHLEDGEDDFYDLTKKAKRVTLQKMPA
eukprot:gnl/MRDRNA2_/MRDRNA2_129092_c0_seq1.p1 gnl/MRDRNA2_/MRDRNA2_129092_c0~~gnl/MRDRNA2_/MRDRNA2_129092_c0_seq1.p1  ORF type:complete len:463 (+),score=88.18 gnl/MRDRNA2_/MRDRNA2_129092_c0_seq1:35-1390(+)